MRPSNALTAATGALVVIVAILMILFGVVVFISQPTDRPTYTMVPVVYDRME